MKKEKSRKRKEKKQSNYYTSICLSSDLFFYGNVWFSALLLIVLAVDWSVATGLLLLIVKFNGRSLKSDGANDGDTKNEQSWRKRAVYCCCCCCCSCSGCTLSLGEGISQCSTAAFKSLGRSKESNGVDQQRTVSLLL
jgi:hypothetical protein